MNVPEVLINLVDVFVIMRRYNVDGRIQRVVGELVETAGMEKKMVLLSSLWSYDLPNARFQELAVSSIYRDRLAQISGKSSKEIMEELKQRANLLQILSEKNIKDIERVTKICRLYITNRENMLKELGLRKEDLS
jgi:hypothetical protein